MTVQEIAARLAEPFGSFSQVLAKWAAIQPDLTRDGQQVGAGLGAVAGMKANAAAIERARTEIK